MLKCIYGLSSVESNGSNAIHLALELSRELEIVILNAQDYGVVSCIIGSNLVPLAWKRFPLSEMCQISCDGAQPRHRIV